ncbi:MAG: RagB/SusD family nutrient uptake outer membrane protein [Bacteroidota bacterium]
MKNKSYSIMLLAISFSMFLSSCSEDFLDKPAFGSLSDKVLADEKGVNALLIGTYGALGGTTDYAALGGGNPWEATPSNWIYGDITGGDAHKGSDGGDQPAINTIATYSVNASNGFFNTKWKALYEGVTRANNVLRVLEQVEEIGEEERANISGQARFLRGHYYFELKKMYNMVPWIDETTENTNVPNDLDIWPNIEADFQFAYDNLPATQGEVGRANKWAAGAYLGKTYLYQAKYPEAKSVFTEVINSGITSNGLGYDLVEDFNHNFNAEFENNKESVFAIQMVANDGTNSIGNANTALMLNYPYNSPFRCCGFYQPTQDLVNSFRTNQSGLPFLNNYNSNPVKSDQGILSSEPFTPDTQSLDPRLDWTVGRRDVPYHDWGYHPGYDWVREQSSGGPYAPKKHIYWQYHADIYADQSSWAPGNAININVIRFADVLLLAAEAEANSGGLSKALEYVNRVRARMANNPEFWLKDYINPAEPLSGFSDEFAANYNISKYPEGSFSSKDFAMDAIMFERRIELAMEGHRFFDLVRWGVAEEVLNNYVQYESQITTDIRGASFSQNDKYFPIPQRQIDLSTTSEGPVLQQNDGY